MGLNKLLMVAYHFPPLAGSSGIQRTLRFVQHLPTHQWQPIVLTADSGAYERVSDDLMRDIPGDVHVCRALALDTARHLAIGGRYLGWMARPDRWMSWRFDAVRRGLRLIRDLRPTALWSTYPIATAHLIGAELQRRSGLPWIADFRDPMAQPGYPADPATHNSFVQIERLAARQAALCVFATPGALRDYQQRYPEAAPRMRLLENGYDEASFTEAEASPDLGRPLNPGRLTILHSGIVYPEERDPRPLFDALAALLTNGALQRGTLRLRFRAPVHDGLLRQLAEQRGIGELIEILPQAPYREALTEMLRADALLVLQSDDCNDQVPAKLYEYLRAARPVLCLADPAGDTARTCLGAGLPDIAPLEDAEAIASRLLGLIEAIHRGTAPHPSPAAIRSASRQSRSAQLAGWLDVVAGGSSLVQSRA